MRTKGGVAEGTIQTSHIDDSQPLQREEEHDRIARKEPIDERMLLQRLWGSVTAIFQKFKQSSEN
jgi:hypothetical protein